MDFRKTVSTKSYVSKRKFPVNLNERDHDLFSHEIEKSIPESYSIEMKNALVTIDGVIIHNGKVISESLWDSTHHNFYGKLYRLIHSKFKKKIEFEEALVIFDAWSTGYFHWMTEVIPKIFHIRENISETKILIPDSCNNIWNSRSALRSLFFRHKSLDWNTGFLGDSLKPFGVKNFQKIKSGQVAFVKNLKLQTKLAEPGNYNDLVMKSLREYYLGYYDLPSVLPTKRIFISRKQANRRFVSNEEEVERLLSQNGFEIVEMERMPFQNQVEIMSQAKFVIGLHGAGLTNILFMLPASSVLELKLRGDKQNHCYFSLANSMEVSYYYQYCEGGKDVQNSDVVVDLDELKKNIELMLSEESIE